VLEISFVQTFYILGDLRNKWSNWTGTNSHRQRSVWRSGQQWRRFVFLLCNS